MRVQHGECGGGVQHLQPQALGASRSGAVRTDARNRWRNDLVLGHGNGGERKALHAGFGEPAPKRSWLVEQGLQNVDELGRKLGVWVLSQPWA